MNADQMRKIVGVTTTVVVTVLLLLIADTAWDFVQAVGAAMEGRTP
jgi:hypothetical protein